VTAGVWAEGYCRFPQRPFRRVFVPLKRPVRQGSEIVTAYTNGRVTLRSNVRTEGYHEALDLSGFQGVAVGDFVVHGLDILRGSVGVADSSGAISSVCTICLPRGADDPRYFAYVIRAQAFSGLPRALARGVREGGADFRRWETLGDLPLPVPPLTRQRAIADFLDSETARIDALISKKRALSQLLDDRRMAVIQSILSPNRAAGDLLKEGPLHGRGSAPLKRFLAGTVAGATPTSDNPDYWADADDPAGVRWIAIGDMVDRGVTDSSVKALSPRGLAACRLSPSPPGTLLFAMYASLGKITETDVPAVWNQAILGLVPRVEYANGRYLQYWLELVQPHLASLARSTTQDNLNAEQVRELPVPYVRVSEQGEVVERLDAQLRPYDLVVGKMRDQIDLLVEHRQALITAAVTGELEIPGVAA
jgi:type I restriction enzyme, S subunit